MINCYQCKKQIISKDDVNVLAFLGIIPRAFCNDCYSKRERGILRHAIYAPKKFPINSRWFKVILIVATAIPFIVIYAMATGKGQYQISGKEVSPEQISLGIKSIFILLFSVLAIWAWTLFLIAKNIIAKIRPAISDK